MTESKVKKLKPKNKKYRVDCGKKLYLLIMPTAMMYWHIRTEKEDGKITDFHIAKYPETSFEQACKLRDEFFNTVKLENKVPVNNKMVRNFPTFNQCAVRCTESKNQEWRNLKHGTQWANTLATYASLSTAAMTYLLKRLNFGDVTTVHGFRSSFRMWAAEQTNYPREVCEQALAHKLPDKVEAAYMRSDFLQKRKLLMQDWANYITSQLTQEEIDFHSNAVKEGKYLDQKSIT